MDNNLPVIRAGRDTINLIFGLFAALQEINRCEREEERRVRAIPGGWRDLRLISVLLEKLVNNMVCTVQPEKLSAMRRMVRHMKFKVVCGPEASQVGRDECIINEDEVNVLVNFAHEQCKLCFDPECSKCKLGKTLDAILTYDRDGCSWANVDLSTMLK